MPLDVGWNPKIKIKEKGFVLIDLPWASVDKNQILVLAFVDF